MSAARLTYPNVRTVRQGVQVTRTGPNAYASEGLSGAFDLAVFDGILPADPFDRVHGYRNLYRISSHQGIRQQKIAEEVHLGIHNARLSQWNTVGGDRDVQRAAAQLLFRAISVECKALSGPARSGNA